MKQNEKQELEPPSEDVNNDGVESLILSQELFCTQDYLTPPNPFPLKGFDGNMDGEDGPCPKSPEKPTTSNGKRCRMDTLGSNSSCDDEPFVELGKDEDINEITDNPRPGSFVSLSAISFRCKLMPPPCIRNPFLESLFKEEIDKFETQRSKFAAHFPALTTGDGLPHYCTNFHQIEEIGRGNFSNVFKVLKRVDGCLYAVKRSIRKLWDETDRTKALMEVQALAALDLHENIVRYYSSWLDDEQLNIQMELCDHSLSIKDCSSLLTAQHEIEALYQIASALKFIHKKGIAHLDVKPENIYVKNGVYKLGDFGCATLLDNSLLVDVGDAHYMPQEVLNENYDHLDKVDIFSLGVSMFELISRLRLPESEIQFSNLKEGKVPLVPGVSAQFQNLLEVMMDPDPVKRPSAAELVERVLEIRNN